MRRIVSVIILSTIISFAFAGPIILPDLTVKRLAQSTEPIERADENKIFTSEDVLSTKTAFLLSLAVPGAGEFYAQSYIKSGVFLAAEAAFWAGFAYYMNQYSLKEDEFESYADSSWFRSYYEEWYDSICAIECTTDLGIEILPETNTQQYYEMIGKYNWFALGWNDIISREDYLMIKDSTYTIALNTPTDNVHDIIVKFLSEFPSPNRETYMNMRSDANDKYTTAKYFIGAAILNHLVSAFDAAFTAKRHNDKLYQGFAGIQEINIRPVIMVKNGEPTPALTCVIRW